MTLHNIDFSLFFPDGQDVLVLPLPRRACLAVSSSAFRQRLASSDLYSSYRRLGQIYKGLLRLRLGLWRPRDLRATVGGSHSALHQFFREIVPNAQVGAVYVQSYESSTKAVAQLWHDDRLVAFLKYAEGAFGCQKIQSEYRVLCAMPDGLAPLPLRCGPVGNGWALLISPLTGRRVKAGLPPQENILRYLKSLVTGPFFEGDRHPWIRSMIMWEDENIVRSLGMLSSRSWPVAIQHGDFAPWNLIILSQSGQLAAVDWENGRIDGFPYIDLAHFILQNASLVYRWSPGKTKGYATACLHRLAWSDLTSQESEAIVKLAALAAYHEYRRSMGGHENAVQAWREQIWHS